VGRGRAPSTRTLRPVNATPRHVPQHDRHRPIRPQVGGPRRKRRSSIRRTVGPVVERRRQEERRSPSVSRATSVPPFARTSYALPNTGDKLRSGARVHAANRRGHEAAPPAERRLRREGWCRRELRQLHPLVGRPRGKCQAGAYCCLTISTEISTAGVVPRFSSQCVVFLSSGQPTPGPYSLDTPFRWSVIVPCSM